MNELEIITATEVITAFSVRVGDGPTVSVQLHGDRYSFGWQGKGDDRLLLNVTHQEARLLAGELAQKLLDLEPLREEYERKRKSLTVWLKAQVQQDEVHE